MIQCHKLKSKIEKGYMIMIKPTFTDEFKQGVVQYVIDHPDKSKVSIAKRFGVATALFING